MAKNNIALIIAASVMASITLLALANPVQAVYDGTFIFGTCNSQKITTASPLYPAIQAVIADVILQTPYFGYEYRTGKQATSDGVTAWGRGNCRYGLPDCAACLQHIGNLILGYCGNIAVGARYQAADCFMEYENFAF